MDKGINRTISQYLALIRQKYLGIEKAYLFGSFASNNNGPNSDIDLALVFDNLDESEKFDVQVQLMILASAIDSRIEPHPISREDFCSNNPFVLEIKRTGIEFS